MKFSILTIAFTILWGWTGDPGQSATPNPEARPKNIVLLIGDGMGLAQISAALYDNNLHLSLEQFPVIGFQKTHSANNLITDSAAAGTALASGKKTKNNVIGLDNDGLPCKTILEEASERGLATGMVVTSSIQHATPACFVAHQKARNMYENIAEDILKSGIDFFIGGGKQYFDRREKDDLNLVEELKKKDFVVYDYFQNELTDVKPSPDKRFAFLTADNQPLPAMQGRDYLPFASKLALDYLKARNPKGFFLMIEGSQIDWSCHANQPVPLMAEMKDFDKTIEKVLSFARKDGETLVIVTADHETGGMALNEGSPRKLDYKFTTNGHTGAMVPVFAYGPQSGLFRGIYENTAIYDKMREAFGFSELGIGN